MTADQQHADFTTPTVLKYADMTFAPTLYRADVPGFRRYAGPNTLATSASGRIVKLPVGEGSPVHSTSAEHLIVGLTGAVEFAFGDDGDVRLVMGKHDVLFIPAHLPYAYTNVGEELASWFTVLTAKDEWPPVASYEDHDPGERPVPRQAG